MLKLCHCSTLVQLAAAQGSSLMKIPSTQKSNRTGNFLLFPGQLCWSREETVHWQCYDSSCHFPHRLNSEHAQSFVTMQKEYLPFTHVVIPKMLVTASTKIQRAWACFISVSPPFQISTFGGISFTKPNSHKLKLHGSTVSCCRIAFKDSRCCAPTSAYVKDTFRSSHGVLY